jgi:hypothetical protein
MKKISRQVFVRENPLEEKIVRRWEDANLVKMKHSPTDLMRMAKIAADTTMEYEIGESKGSGLLTLVVSVAVFILILTLIGYMLWMNF